MRRTILIAILIVSILSALPGQKVLPWHDRLVAKNDTLHVITASEKGWALSEESYAVLIINNTGGWLHYRFDTETGAIYRIIENGGCGPVPPPFVLPAPVDSVFIKAEIAGTVHVEWYAVE